MNLEGKVAFVTGGSRGIGKEIAISLAKAGADIAINYVSNESKAIEVVDEINKLGRKAIALQGNISSSTDVDSMFGEVISTFGQVDVLVNNAGITKDTLLMRMKESDWDNVVDTNLKGVFLCTKVAAKHMMRNRFGRIINISSIVGVIGNPGQANYVASKAGVIGLTKTAAKELASRNITVNAIAPGFITTDMTDELQDSQKELLLQQIPLQKLGKPEDIAAMVVYLSSDFGQYITGQTIHINGGMYM